MPPVASSEAAHLPLDPTASSSNSTSISSASTSLAEPHPRPGEPFTCSKLCAPARSFDTEEQLIDHWRSTHFPIKALTIGKPGGAIFDIYRTNEGYVCTRCRDKFWTIKKFTKHIHLCSPKAIHFVPDRLPISWQLVFGRAPVVEDQPAEAGPVRMTKRGRLLKPPNRFANGTSAPPPALPPPPPPVERPPRRPRAPPAQAAAQASSTSATGDLPRQRMLPPAQVRRRLPVLPPRRAPSFSPPAKRRRHNQLPRSRTPSPPPPPDAGASQGVVDAQSPEPRLDMRVKAEPLRSSPILGPAPVSAASPSSASHDVAAFVPPPGSAEEPSSQPLDSSAPLPQSPDAQAPAEPAFPASPAAEGSSSEPEFIDEQKPFVRFFEDGDGTVKEDLLDWTLPVLESSEVACDECPGDVVFDSLAALYHHRVDVAHAYERLSLNNHDFIVSDLANEDADQHWWCTTCHTTGSLDYPALRAHAASCSVDRL